jgi:hypothetical protein
MQFNQPDTLVPNLYNTLDWNRYSYARGNPLRYTDPDGHFAIPVAVIAVAVIALKVIDYGWTAYDVISSASVALDANNAPEVRQEALAAAAVAIGAELLEPDDLSPVAVPLDDIVRHGDDIGEFIYKKGAKTTDSVTPRPGHDDLDLENGGLSFWDSVENMNKHNPLGPNDKILTVDPKQIDGLDIIKDNNPPGHISIRPPTLSELQEWASTRGTDVIHKFTQTMWDAIVDVKKWKDWK